MVETSRGTFAALLDSLPPYPQMRLLLFCRGWGEEEEELLRFAREGGHSVLLYRMGEEGPIPEDPLLSVKPYREEQPRYNLRGRLYNHAFVLSEPPEEPREFLPKLHTGIANAGGVYIGLPADDPERLREWERALEESYYVAAHPIEIDRERLILGARKMHGWGG